MLRHRQPIWLAKSSTEIEHNMIKKEDIRRAEQLALTKKCRDCGTTGKWKATDVTGSVNLLPQPGRRGRDFDNPMLVFVMTCTHLVDGPDKHYCGGTKNVNVIPS
jgi:hypothetical protein